MKKFALILFILPFVAIQAQTFQPLPDGSFDNWDIGYTNTLHEDCPSCPYDKLANPFWETLNLLSTLEPEQSTGPVVFWKDEGLVNYAPKAKSDTLWVGEDKLFLPGVFGAFTVLIDQTTAHFGRPYTSRPDSLVGYLKYHPVGGDSARIFVKLYTTMPLIGRTEIGVADITFHDSINEWTRFSIPIEYLVEPDNDYGTPDSATVLFVSSAAFKIDDLFNCEGNTGSTIWADECKFIFNSQASIEDVKTVKHNALVYPNPTSGDVFVKTQIPVKKARIEILDVKGSIVKTQELSGMNTSIDLRSLKSSLYLYRIIDGGKIIESGRINLIK